MNHSTASYYTNQAITNAAPCLSKLAILFHSGKLSKLHFEHLKLSLKNDKSLIWIMWDDVCCGRITLDGGVPGETLLFKKNLPPTEGVKILALIRDYLFKFNKDPLAAALEYGKSSGSCCVCGRFLTNPTSVEEGIGPICSGRLS